MRKALGAELQTDADAKVCYWLLSYDSNCDTLSHTSPALLHD